MFRSSWTTANLALALSAAAMLAASPALAQSDASAANAAEQSPEAAQPAPKGLSGRLSKMVTPYVVIAGGLRFERLFRREGETDQSRNPTMAVSQMGLRGAVGDHITFRSEIEANLGGPLGYGASAWEGQAQLSVRDQWLKYSRNGVAVALGRVTDEATFDFYSAHVADLLLLDWYTRWPLVYSGADRGTGLLATYELHPSLTAGITLHSTNPTGTTASYQIGGALFPYSRPFLLAAAAVGNNSDNTPDTNLHLYFGTFSLVYRAPLVQAKAAIQGYALDTQMATDTDQPIYGYNLRANVRLSSPDHRYAVWLNGSRNANERLAPLDATIKLRAIYTLYTASAGVDYHYQGENGVGLQYAFTRQYEAAEPGFPETEPSHEHYVNVGTTYWVTPGVLSVGGRLGYYLFDDNQTERTGHASLFLTGRLIL